MKMGTGRSFATRTIALTCSVVRGRAMTAGMPPGVGPQSRVWQIRSTSLSLTYSAPQMAARRSVRSLNVPPLTTDDGRPTTENGRRLGSVKVHLPATVTPAEAGVQRVPAGVPGFPQKRD